MQDSLEHIAKQVKKSESDAKPEQSIFPKYTFSGPEQKLGAFLATISGQKSDMIHYKIVT